MHESPAEVTPDDEILFSRFRAGDARAFESLYQRHRSGLYRYLYGLCRERELADELFQETWLSLIRTKGRPRQAGFRSWLYRTARNRLIDHWRKQGRLPSVSDHYDERLHAVPDNGATPERQFEFIRDGDRLQQALAQLPEEQRDVFLLRSHGELELNEIAELTQTPMETVKSRLRYAVNKLRRLLTEPQEVH